MSPAQKNSASWHWNKPSLIHKLKGDKKTISNAPKQFPKAQKTPWRATDPPYSSNNPCKCKPCLSHPNWMTPLLLLYQLSLMVTGPMDRHFSILIKLIYVSIRTPSPWTKSKSHGFYPTWNLEEQWSGQQGFLNGRKTMKDIWNS